jgi:hypothetical protein
MSWTMVNNLLLGTNMDTWVFHPRIVKVMLSCGVQGVSGYIYSLLIVFPWSKYGRSHQVQWISEHTSGL